MTRGGKFCRLTTTPAVFWRYADFKKFRKDKGQRIQEDTVTNLRELTCRARPPESGD